jgi:CspA family cold shock protein
MSRLAVSYWQDGERPETEPARNGELARESRPLPKKNVNGSVLRELNAQKGFGFIQPQDGGKDVLVYISAVECAGISSLAEGQELSFDEERGGGGRISAANLQTA